MWFLHILKKKKNFPKSSFLWDSKIFQPSPNELHIIPCSHGLHGPQAGVVEILVLEKTQGRWASGFSPMGKPMQK